MSLTSENSIIYNCLRHFPQQMPHSKIVKYWHGCIAEVTFCKCLT